MSVSTLISFLKSVQLAHKIATTIPNQGKDAKFNAKEILNLLKNKNTNPFFKDIVLLNTSACLVIADKAKNLKEGLMIANKNLINGKALDQLNKLISISNE